jgi:hypothetical protein
MFVNNNIDVAGNSVDGLNTLFEWAQRNSQVPRPRH